MSKTKQMQITLPHEVAFFIAKRVVSNVRELETVLRRVIANSNTMKKQITIKLTKDALRYFTAAKDKQVAIENGQNTVADYYRINVVDILSK